MLFSKVGTDLGESKESTFSMVLLWSLDMQLGGTCRFCFFHILRLLSRFVMANHGGTAEK